jgi:anion-transporting  ArsA/GET3 family ATPase
VIEIAESTKALVCIGSGGVGKTTLAASLALGQAALGRKVFILTIDPSRRLAQALNFKTDGKVYLIETPEIKNSGGSLETSVLQHENVFSEFFIEACASQPNAEKDIQRIKNNRLFRQLSTQLGSSQDFTAIYKLNQLVRSGKYDLVVLDTPPAQHTWQFLQAPEKIAQLFNEGVAQWFRESQDKKGIINRVLNMGTRQVLKALETLTGSEFLIELSLFFQAIQKWQGPLEKQVLDCHKLLVSETTQFLLVTGLDSSRMMEAQLISQEILKEGYKLTGLVLNRFPDWALQDDPKQKIAKTLPDQQIERLKELKKYYLRLTNEVALHQSNFQKNLVLYKSAELRQSDLNINGLLNMYSKIEPLKKMSLS